MKRERRFIFLALGMCVAVCASAAAQGPNVIRPGDVVYVEVFRVPEMSRTYLVGEDGAIRLPYIPPVSVGGLSEDAASETITGALRPILHQPRVTVSRSDIGLSAAAPGRTSEMQMELIPLRNSSAETLASVLQGMSTAGGSVGFDPDTNSLIVTDTPQAIKNMMNVIARLDQMQSQMTQVRIESRIAEVRVGALKELGVRWFAQGDNFSGGFIPPPTRLNSINSLRSGFGRQEPEFIGREDETGGDDFALDREFVGDEFTQRLNFPAVVPIPGQLALGFMGGDVDLGTLLDALVSDEEAELLANPTILTVNHKPATIKMVDEFPFAEFGTEITGRSNFSIEFLDLGIILDVTPHVYEDPVGTYVKLELKPEVSFPTGIANGVPIRSVRSSESVANVRDGQTLVVGGILSEDEQLIDTGVPGLKDIPVVGRLFRVKESSNQRTELMIFVTPTVHRRPEEITWDKMIDVASGINKADLIPANLAQREVRKN